MNELNVQFHKEYKPVLAVVVYKSNENNDLYENFNQYYLESHAINDAGQLMEGKPLQAQTISGMVEVFKDKAQQDTRISGNIPACLLHYLPAAGGEYKIVWHRPATQRTLHFTPELRLKSGLASVPPLLFIASAAHLRVYALASGRRPVAKAKIYAAPFHNVSSDGRVCLGSAKARTPAVKSFENLITYWEEMFWASKFSAVHNEKAVKGGLPKVWKGQVSKPYRPFSIDWLNETKFTFQQLINGK